MYTVLTHFSYKAMQRLGKHTRCDFRTHAQLDAPSVMCDFRTHAQLDAPSVMCSWYYLPFLFEVNIELREGMLQLLHHFLGVLPRGGGDVVHSLKQIYKLLCKPSIKAFNYEYNITLTIILYTQDKRCSHYKKKMYYTKEIINNYLKINQ